MLEGYANGQLVKLGIGEVAFQKVILSSSYRTVANVEIKGDLKKLLAKLSEVDNTPVAIPSKRAITKAKKGAKRASTKSAAGKPLPVESEEVYDNSIGVLSLQLELCGERRDEQQYHGISEIEDSSTPVPRPTTHSPFEQVAQAMQPLLLQMYLSLKEAKDV